MLTWRMKHSEDGGMVMTHRNRLWFAGIVAALLLVVLVTCSSCGPRPPALHLPDLYNPAVARLAMTAKDGGRGHCTAWKLDDDLIATAGHCCDEGTTYSLEGHNTSMGDIEPPRMLVDDDVHDVCVLTGKIKGIAIEIADDEPERGQAVWTAGYPRGYFLISSGYWSGGITDSGYKPNSVVINPGESGAPLLNKRSQAVGVLVAYVPGTDNIALASPLVWLRRAAQVARSSGGEPVQLTAPAAQTDDIDKLLQDILNDLKSRS